MKKLFIASFLVLVSILTQAQSVTTDAVSSITSNSAIGGGVATSIAAWITDEGLCWVAGAGTPTVANFTAPSGNPVGAGVGSGSSRTFHSVSMTGLLPATLYTVRAFSSSNGTPVYGPSVTFTTAVLLPVVTTPVTAIFGSTASSGGTISNAVSCTQKGVVWSTSPTPTTALATKTAQGAAAAGASSYTSSITGLTSKTTYYLRAYIVDGGVTYYGAEITFLSDFVGNKTVTISSKWRFGNNAGLDFSGATATATAATANLIPAGSPESSVTMTDTADNIIFHTDTRRIFTLGTGGSLLRYIETDDNMAASSATQGGLAIPDPASPFNTWYLFLANDISAGPKVNLGINYYKITKSSGGVISIASGPTNLIGNVVDETITATPDGQGGYWLLSHSQTTTEFYEWRVTTAGISGLTKFAATSTNAPTADPYQAAQSCLKVNLCATKIIWGRAEQIRIHAFNRATGAITLAPTASVTSGALSIKPVYHVEFSPDGSKAYATARDLNQLIQIDAATGATTVLLSSEVWGLQLGPNGNLYVSGNGGSGAATNQYYEITNPNSTTPTITAKTTPASTFMYRGLANMPAIGSAKGIQAGGKLKKSPTNCRDFMFGFKYYNINNDPITLTGATWTFTDNVTNIVTTVVAPNPYTDSVNYVLPTTNAFTVSVTVTDGYCGGPIKSNTFVVTPSCGLPVEFMSISAASQPGTTKVFWSTAIEKNSSNFTVQRSADGKNFQSIGTVAAAGNSRSIRNYTYQDKDPLDGIVYYRVIENDDNGDQIFSTIVSTASQTDGKIYTISNNPFKNELSLNMLGEKDIRIDIFESSGKLVYSNRIEDASGSISLGSDLNSGAYILEVIDNTTGKVYRDKILKY